VSVRLSLSRSLILARTAGIITSVKGAGCYFEEPAIHKTWVVVSLIGSSPRRPNIVKRVSPSQPILSSSS